MYKCAICGNEYNGLDEYMECVKQCGAKLKEKEEAEKTQKRMEEINAALNRVKQAKTYFENQLAQFKEKYPVEYDLNFGDKKKKVDTDKSEKVKKENYNPESVSISYKKKNDEDPDIHAKVNGKDVALEELLSDPDVKHLAEVLGFLG